MDAFQWRRFVRLSVAEGALATAMATLMSGVVLTGLALSLGANEAVIGLLATLPSLANVVQLIGARWLNAGVNRKRLCISSLAASRAIWVAIVAIPLVASYNPSAAIAGLVILVAVSNGLASLGGVAWLSWIRDVVPAERRLGFLGLRNQFDTVLALSLSIVGAAFIDWWQADQAAGVGGFIWVLAAAMVCGLAGIPVLSRIADPSPPVAAAAPSEVTAAPTPPHEQRNFRRLVQFYVCWHFASNLAAPFFTVFMLQNLHLEFWKITSLQALTSIAALAANGFWTRLGRRIGTRPVVFLATACDAAYPLCWALMGPGAEWALPLVCLWGVFNTPLAVGGPTLVMRLAPDQRSSSYLAAFNAIIGVVMAAAAVLGGQLAAHAGGAFTLAGASLGGLQLVFLLSFVGRAGSLWLLHRVREPSELPLGELVRKAMSVRVGPRPAADRKPPAASATAGVELSPLDSAA